MATRTALGGERAPTADGRAHGMDAPPATAAGRPSVGVAPAAVRPGRHAARPPVSAPQPRVRRRRRRDRCLRAGPAHRDERHQPDHVRDRPVRGELRGAGAAVARDQPDPEHHRDRLAPAPADRLAVEPEDRLVPDLVDRRPDRLQPVAGAHRAPVRHERGAGPGGARRGHRGHQRPERPRERLRAAALEPPDRDLPAGPRERLVRRSSRWPSSTSSRTSWRPRSTGTA